MTTEQICDNTVWRVRRVSCDGGRLGREWSSEFFYSESTASDQLLNLILESNRKNPNYPFNDDPETVDGVCGWCNWQFGIMVTVDSVRVR